MRILQVITLCELGGAQSVVANLSNKLCENHEVIVAAGEGDGKMFDLLDKSIKTERIPSLVRRLSPLNEIKTIIALRKLYRKYRPDIIHLHSSKAGILGRIAFPAKKVVYTVHGFDSIRIAYRKFLPLEKFLQKRCAAIIGVSKYDEQNLKAEGITRHVGTVYNGIFPPPALQSDPFLHIAGYTGKVLCIARLAPPKDHGLFIEVAKLLPEYAFVWIGNQSEPDFEYPSNVFFMGNIPGAASYTAYADIFMLPSNYEGLPMVIIEALANGTPVVASAVGGISELLDGSNGFAVENNAQLMAKRIEAVLKASDEHKRAFKQAASETYLKKFTVEQMTNGYLSEYNRINKAQI